MEKYPCLEINDINEFIPLVGNGDIVMIDKGDHIVFDYLVQFADTFPEIKSRQDALRRECRGLIFDKAGNLIRRPYHKFFNVNERPESLISEIDLNQEHIILEKLDGSMVAPFLIDDELVFGTMQGRTDFSPKIYDWVHNNCMRIGWMSRQLIKDGFTPIFEWCAPTNRIVIPYKETNLILTGVRNMKTGEYLNYEELTKVAFKWGLKPVKSYSESQNNLAEFINWARDRRDEEGYVIRFEDGRQYKIKNDWYVAIHKAKEHISLEKNVWQIILEDRQDDLMSKLDNRDKDIFEEFNNKFLENLYRTSDELSKEFIAATSKYPDQKDFAVNFANKIENPIQKAFMFAMKNNNSREPLEIMKSLLLKNSTSINKINEVRKFVANICWDDYYNNYTIGE